MGSAPVGRDHASTTSVTGKPRPAAGQRPLRRAGAGNSVLAVLASTTALVPLPNLPQLTGASLTLLLFFPVVAQFARTPRVRVISILCIGTSACSLGGSVALGGAPPSLNALLVPVALACSVVVLAWGSDVLGFRLVVFLAAVPPMLFDAISRSEQGNLWKYALSVWAVLLVLAAIEGRSAASRALGYVMLLVVSAIFDTRNIIIFVLLAALWDISTAIFNARWQRTAASVLAVLLGGYLLAQFAVSGVLGETIERTTLEQSRGGMQRLVENARPEARGNWQLIVSDPVRVQVSQELSAEDAAVVRASFAGVGRDPNSMYVREDVLTSSELHSIAADGWFHLGTVGLLLAVSALVFSVRSIRVLAFSRPAFGAIAVFGATRMTWDVLFSPLTDLRFWPLLLVAVLVARSGAESSQKHVR